MTPQNSSSILSTMTRTASADGESINLKSRFALMETPKKGSLSIYSTDLHRGVIISTFENQSIGREVRWPCRTGLEPVMPRRAL